jgi:ABC-type branched-subunit amino acid transport system substrate-binding protein
MGILLAFMFLWNMVGALVLLPALARFLLRPGVLALALAAAIPVANAATDTRPIVIGQSLPITGPAYPIANRIQAGAKAWVERVNARGGVQGRAVEVVTLDDAGDNQRVAVNLRKLVQDRGAVAIVNCLGEQACAQAATTTAELGVPLVGTFSGAAALRAASMTHVFPLRADDKREAESLARQLQAIGVSRIAWLADGEEPAREQAITDALRVAGIATTRVATGAATIDTALRTAAKVAPQALLLSLGPAATDALSRAGQAAHDGMPSLVATSSSPGLTQLTRLFRDRTIGFTSVVPNPEVSQLPLVREFESDADTYVGPEAVSFEGLASYIHLRVCTAALRAGGARRLVDALEHLGTVDLGGLRLQLAPGQRQGLDLVEIGLRARDGKLRR